MPDKSSVFNKDQLDLLETLTYLDNETPFKKLSEAGHGQTIESFLMSFEGKIEDDKMYHSFISGRDWKRIISRVLSDKELCKLTIAESHTDQKYGGESCLFLRGDKEAIFAYRGTAPLEWEDNVKGASNIGDKVETECQMIALDWYRDACEKYGLKFHYKTVVGHSKGGNKAKFITIMDDSVDKCVSFDGQGFSDNFFDEHIDKIYKNQGKIENHNVDNDFVNILLNDVGKKTFYKASEVGSFARNHCPHVFLEAGSKEASMEVAAERNPVLTMGHELLNSFCRTITPECKKDTIETLSKVLSSVMGKIEDNNRKAREENAKNPEKANKTVSDIGLVDRKVLAAEKKANDERLNNMTTKERHNEVRKNKELQDENIKNSPIHDAIKALANKSNGAENIGRLLAFAKQYVFSDKNNEKLFENTVKDAAGGGVKGWLAGKAAKFALKHPGALSLIKPMVAKKYKLDPEERKVFSEVIKAAGDENKKSFNIKDGKDRVATLEAVKEKIKNTVKQVVVNKERINARTLEANLGRNLAKTARVRERNIENSLSK